MNSIELSATLWPSFPHFKRFINDPRLNGGIRLNSAMLGVPEIDKELELLEGVKTPWFFDVKGRQLRIESVDLDNKKHLDITLNHPIEVETPTPVLFKAGADGALLEKTLEGGKRLIFRGGPQFMVKAGESLHIRHPSLKVLGPVFTEIEKKKIEKFKRAGCKRWFLSYVEKSSDVEEFESLVGKGHEIRLKIESVKGVNWAFTEFYKREHLSLVLARGDLYVELKRPHQILEATQTIITCDPEATVGSRLLLSTVTDEVPSCADFNELAWLYDVGYRRMMLCDEMCLRENLLSRAVDAFQAFKESYV